MRRSGEPHSSVNEDLGFAAQPNAVMPVVKRLQGECWLAAKVEIVGVLGQQRRLSVRNPQATLGSPSGEFSPPPLFLKLAWNPLY